MKAKEKSRRFWNQVSSRFSLPLRLTALVSVEMVVCILVAYAVDVLCSDFIAQWYIPLLVELLAMSLLFGLLLTSYLSRLFFAPIKRLNAAMKQVAEGDFTIRLDTQTSSREIREINSGFNLMVHELGVTDVVDGFIARKFHMISDFGKAFDPVADKLTQIVMLACLISRFPHMLVPFVILVAKEIFDGVTSLIAIHRSGTVEGAAWHGKATTVALYAMMLVHLVWYDIPGAVSWSMNAVCTALMLVSAVLYGIRNFRMILGRHEKKEE